MTPNNRLAIALLLVAASTTATAADITQRKDVQQFIDKMVNEHGFDRAQVQADLRQVRIQPKIIAAMNRPAEGMPWYRYRKIFDKPRRINDGVAFWSKYQNALSRAEREFGVDPAVITAIIGVETLYGTNKGSWRVIDALATLGFDYPRRAKFFSKELEEFLILTAEERVDPLSLKGSYAGAMGWGQFMPSSYRHYAVDFDGDGRRDLISNPVDAIGSVANYLKQHGWLHRTEITLPVKVKGKPKGLPDGNDKPTVRVSELPGLGITLSQSVAGDPVTNFIQLETAKGRHGYWVGFKNFYVITRYNRSQLYSMAVYDLSRAIARKKG